MKKQVVIFLYINIYSCTRHLHNENLYSRNLIDRCHRLGLLFLNFLIVKILDKNIKIRILFKNNTYAYSIFAVAVCTVY